MAEPTAATSTPGPRPDLVLASGSPRRADLLAQLGLRFTVEPADLDEASRPDEPADRYVERLAREKAAAKRGPDRLVIAADTAVVLDGALLGKPVDADDAASMLARLSGRPHEVCTGIAVCEGSRTVAAVDTAVVTFGTLSPREIAWYVGTGEPLDKAGAYGVQGAGGLLVAHVAGNPQTVIGLPMRLLADLVRSLGHDLLDWAR